MLKKDNQRDSLDNIREALRNLRKNKDQESSRKNSGIFIKKKQVFPNRSVLRIYKLKEYPVLYETREKMLFSNEINFPDKFIIHKYRYDEDGSVFFYEIKVIDIKKPNHTIAKTYLLDKNGVISQTAEQEEQYSCEINEFIEDIFKLNNDMIKSVTYELKNLKEKGKNLNEMPNETLIKIERKTKKLEQKLEKLKNDINMINSLKKRFSI